MTSQAGKLDDNPEDRAFGASLLGTILIKAGYEDANRERVSQAIYDASKGSEFLNQEQRRSEDLANKVREMKRKKETLGLSILRSNLLQADQEIARIEESRDLSQFIVHVDCDCFYASIEVLDHPELQNTPFAVGDVVLATCNYIARQSGCRSGMLATVARKLCPSLTVLKANHEKYKAKTKEMRQVLTRYDPDFEICGEDEAYLNITQYCIDNKMEAIDAVDKLRADVKDETGLAVGAGLAANIQLAKICSTINKPDGVFELINDKERILEFMANLAPRKAIGVGKALDSQLTGIDILVCGDIFAQRHFLPSLFGESTMRLLLQIYLGCGRTKLKPAHEIVKRSISVERTFPQTSAIKNLEEKLGGVCDEVARKLTEIKASGRTLTLKLRFKTFDNYTRQITLPKAVNTKDAIFTPSLSLLSALLQKQPNEAVRLIGLRVTNFADQKVTRAPSQFRFFEASTSKSVLDFCQPLEGATIDRVTYQNDATWPDGRT
ncbi:hypothetical protein FSARC_8009 [Fusarium sarcochroum]|uniref:DNA polymerase kappa n=1 Tax=Fusarium sarcochroum TaxID=1208366 RepID=A0A8H4TU47_9HYPO|nr:hypothetical protein FSARC_8009 [Fusarium sarcochroum]